MTIAAWVFLLLGLIGCLAAATALLPRPGSIDRVSVWYLGFALPGSEVSALLATLGIVLAAAGWAIGIDGHAVGRVALALHAAAVLGLLWVIWRSRGAGRAIDTALAQAFGGPAEQHVAPTRLPLLRRKLDPAHWWRPVSFGCADVTWTRHIPYTADAHKQQHLDVMVSKTPAAGPRPVLLNIHGGGWMIGEKGTQAMPLLMHMARCGWLVVDADYRLSPGARFPDHLVDVKRAIAWTRENAARLGGDPRFIVLTGGSAGGHLTALAALTAGQPAWQPGFEHADTQVQLAVPYYGKFDTLAERQPDEPFQDFMASNVFPRPKGEDPALWRDMAPASHIASPATGAHPPFFVLHGTHDELIPVEEARWFVQRLRQALGNEVIYAEIPNAHHAFDVFHSLRADLAAEAVQRGLEVQYARWCRRTGVEPTPAAA
jgi:acetyl esterase/lipase